MWVSPINSFNAWGCDLSLSILLMQRYNFLSTFFTGFDISMAFKDIIGQDKVVTILSKTIQRGRVPSSYLFAGESGIGKKLTAINLAKTLNCLTLPAFPTTKGGETYGSSLDKEGHRGVMDACDICDSCKKIEKGIHPDFLLIAPESGQIRIEEIRTIDDTLSLKAFEGKYKIVIVDDADTMNQYAANAFLKTLEEPPENSLIILIASKPDRLPDTIRSRCSRINFTPLSQNACGTVIEKVIKQQVEVRTRKPKKEQPPDALDPRFSTMVRLSMGRPGIALAADLLEEREWFMKLLKEMLNAEKDGWASKEEMERWFELLLVLLRDIAVMKITRNKADLINVDLGEYVNTLSRSMDLQGIIENCIQINTLKGYFNFHLNKALTWNYTGSLLRAGMDISNA
jgi:DNA polymerase III subunit delta'